MQFDTFQKHIDKARQAYNSLMEEYDSKQQLLRIYKHVEAAETYFKDIREELDKLIAQRFPTADEEGSKTTEYGDYKVKTQKRKYYRVDSDADIDSLPDVAQKVFRNKKKVKKGALKDLSKVDKDAYEDAIECINISEGKTGVSVERT